MNFSRSITEIIQNRFSCRTYLETPIRMEQQQQLKSCLSQLGTGPLGTPLRFDLIAASEQDSSELRGLGTYGFIKGARGFMAGAMCQGKNNLEDYGYRLEQATLYATDLGLGTCWLGGSFTKSSFAHRLSVSREESIPAVISLGYIPDEDRARRSLVRRQVGSDQRLPWENLFFEDRFGVPLTPEQAGRYAVPLEMVRLGPSASNKQPWRIVQAGSAFHFYLQRTKGYRDGLVQRLLRVEDLQRADLGIAMCHFELTAQELGLNGRWVVQEPKIKRPDALTEYTVSWMGVPEGRNSAV